MFAPKPRDYSYTVNKKVKRLALKSALSAKAASGDVVVVDGLNLDAIKTKNMKGFLDAVGAKKAVVVTPEVNQNVVLSARNIPRRGHHHRQGAERVRHRQRRQVYRGQGGPGRH